MIKDEALKLALEALKVWVEGFSDFVDEIDEQAITAIKEALAQPVQEPDISRPKESNYTSQVSYTRALEAYCDTLTQEPDELTIAYMSGLYDGKKAEREACAKVCEDGINNATDWDSSAWDQACENRATAIRARGQA